MLKYIIVRGYISTSTKEQGTNSSAYKFVFHIKPYDLLISQYIRQVRFYLWKLLHCLYFDVFM